VSVAVGPFLDSEHHLACAPEELCVIPDTIDELFIALQTSADASLDS
jgi:hypothetical protein